MRVTLVNPPYPTPVMRRFVASYFAPNFLLPPTDLLYAAAAARELTGAETTIVDCIAKKLSDEQAVNAVAASKPDVVFAQVGFATLENDLQFCDRIKQATGALVVAMGYLPTVYAREVMEASQLDAIVRGEPELVFVELLRAWGDNAEPGEVEGLVLRKNGDIVFGPEPQRIADLDALPRPDHAGVDLHNYHEVLLGSPVAAIFTARGCPFACTFCVRTYGRQLALRSAQSVVDEAAFIVNELGVRNLRLMDDTFNIDRERVLAICAGLQKLQPLRWTALARLDQVDEKTLRAMADSGCKRLYVGVESGSDHMLDVYKKGMNLETMRRGLALIKAAGIEVSAFFIVGGPGETRADFEASLAFAKQTKLDYVIVTRLQYWPGTELFETTEGIETSIVPFVCRPADHAAYDKLLDLEREFYRRFYLRPAMIARHFSRLLTHPRDLLRSVAKLARYVFTRDERDFI